ncbi:hexokinase [Bacteroidia bacterium]|nr:hexokinase [Bacteroidia bacterium]GHU78533.1 hexokinase [Bacteroidia bacterium]
MENNIFELTTGQLKRIATTLQAKITEGLQENGKQIRCLPTYIIPKTNLPKEKVLVLDLGGTNFRATVVDFTDETPVVHEGVKKNLEYVMKAPAGKSKDELYAEMANLISSLNLEGVKSIGYCFSYPCESTLDGDAVLLYWTKGVTIKGMENELVGKSLVKYLNEHVKSANFTGIKVINDTVASLFAGLTDKTSQAHIGLIVGTGTNMAPFFPTDKIPKLNPDYKQKGLIPVNLESGNFYPPFLTVIDDKIDKYSDTPGAQRFEKAISGMYLGRLLEFIFSCEELEANFDAEKLTRIMSYPDMYKEKYVQAAFWVYERSAKLVAASLAGLILKLIASYDVPITDVRLTAEGSLFWSEDQKGQKNVKFKSYKDLVLDQLNVLLKEAGHGDMVIHVEKTANANLIGSAIAALS